MKDIYKIILISIALIVIYYLAQYIGIGLYFGEKFYPILGSFFMQAIAIHLIFRFGISTLEMTASTLAMLSMVIRMLSSLMIVVVLVLLGVNDMVNFIITFFTVYLFYFVFEIKSVLSNLRSN